MNEYFPNGIWHYLLGGMLIGVGVAWIFLATGIRAGASGVLTAAMGYVVQSPYFQRFRDERAWRVCFTLGLIAGAAIYTVAMDERFVTGVPAWRLAVGGFFVGLGTRAARGCTSGHGICGLSSLNGRSLVHVLIFMSVAIVTARVVRGVMS